MSATAALNKLIALGYEEDVLAVWGRDSVYDPGNVFEDIGHKEISARILGLSPSIYLKCDEFSSVGLPAATRSVLAEQDIPVVGTPVAMSADTGPWGDEVVHTWNASQRFEDTNFIFGDEATFEDAFTLMVWYRRNTADSGVSQMLVEIVDTFTTKHGVYIICAGDDKVYVRMETGGVQSNIIASTTISLDTWHLIVATAPAGAGARAIALSVDGVDMGTTTSAGLLGNDGSTIGARVGGALPIAANSLMSDICLINGTAISFAQALTLYGGGTGTRAAWESRLGALTTATDKYWPMTVDTTAFEPTSDPNLTDYGSTDTDWTPSGNPIYGSTGAFTGASTAVTFDGSTDYFTGPVVSQDAITIECVFNTSDTGAWKTLVDFRDSAVDGVTLRINNLEGINWLVNTLQVNTTKTVTDGNWHHVAVTWDKAAGSPNALVYIDGVLDATTGHYTAASISVTTPGTIGKDSYQPGNNFTGSMQHVAIHNTALTAKQIRYNAISALRAMDATLVGAPTVTGGTLTLDGSTQYATIPHRAWQIPNPWEITLICAVDPDDNEARGTLISKMGDTAATNQAYRFEARYQDTNPDKTLEANTIQETTHALNTRTAVEPPAFQDKPQVYTFKFDTGTGDWTMFVDGVASANVALLAGYICNAVTTDMLIGATNPASPALLFAGKLGPMVFIHASLSDDEIAQVGAAMVGGGIDRARFLRSGGATTGRFPVNLIR